MCEKLFQYSSSNNGLLIALQDIRLESLLEEARNLEKKYEWLQVAEKIGTAVDLVEEKHYIKATEFLEKMGFCFYKAAMQAPDNTQFAFRMKLAIQTYEKEFRLLEEMEKEDNHVLALIAYTRSCLEKIPSKKKKLLAEWWNYEKHAKKEFESIGDFYSVAKICVNLVEYSSYDWIWSSSSFSETRNIYLECLNFAERAIKILTKLEDKYELARAYCFASWHYSFCVWFWESEEEIVPYAQKAEDYSKKALELAQSIGDAWLISQSYINIWNVTNSLNSNPNLAINPGNKILRFGEITKDNWCMGWGHALTAFSNVLAAAQIEDPDKQKQGYEKSLKMARESNKLFQRIHGVHELHIASAMHTMAFRFLANLETNKKKKISMLKTLSSFIQEKKEFFKNRETINSGFSYQLSVNFFQLAKTEIEIEKKRNFLLQAKSCIEEQIKFSNEMHPFNVPHRSRNHFQLASVLRELAGIDSNKQKKIEMLNHAADSMRRCLEQIQKRKNFFQKSAWGYGYYFGRYHDYLGKILQEGYLLTRNEKTLIEGIETYKKTIFFMKQAGLLTHLAEAYWHLAQLHDQIGEFKYASKNYELAAQTYETASKKIPSLKDFYKDHSLYMQAWSQIEQARHNHCVESYEEARQNYQQAAKLHESTISWSYLAPNYFAWSYVEEAEGLSRKEDTIQAKQEFKKALQQFSFAEKSIKQKLSEIKSSDEKEIAQRLFNASDLRRKYCQARILLEDAKLWDRAGQYLKSSRSYGEAA